MSITIRKLEDIFCPLCSDRFFDRIELDVHLGELTFYVVIKISSLFSRHRFIDSFHQVSRNREALKDVLRTLPGSSHSVRTNILNGKNPPATYFAAEDVANDDPGPRVENVSTLENCPLFRDAYLEFERGACTFSCPECSDCFQRSRHFKTTPSSSARGLDPRL